MKEFIDVAILAVLQGVAEFLPISSSGHLVIGQHLLGLELPGMRLDVFLHVGTLGAIVAYYWRSILAIIKGLFSAAADTRREAWEFVAKIVLSAVPAIIVYLIFHKRIDAFFENAKMVGALLMFTGAVLIGTRYMPSGGRKVSFLRALWMGVMQAVALLPGVSRSGMTLVAARSGRIDSSRAAEFSFLMSAPLIAGAAFLDLIKSVDVSEAGELSWGYILFGAVLSGLVGYISLKLLVATLKGRWFWLFGPYCVIAGLLTLCFCK